MGLKVHYFGTLSPFCRAQATSADPDQTPQNVALDQGLHCFPTKQFNL